MVDTFNSLSIQSKRAAPQLATRATRNLYSAQDFPLMILELQEACNLVS
jgi:hypothetical protein